MLLNEKYAHLDRAEDLVPVAVRIMQFKMRASRRGRGAGDVPVDSIPIPDTGPDPERAARYEQLRSRMMEAIETLGSRCRQLFRLKLEGYNFIEIREKMQAASINTIYTWDLRCRRDLIALTRVGGGKP
jgi:RNA polymerase sigma-70 factor (ECF subfamily)